MSNQRKIEKEWDIHDYDKKIARYHDKAERELSKRNYETLMEYDKSMIRIPLSKALRYKHFGSVMIMTKRLSDNKEWKDVLKNDIDDMTVWIMETYGDHKGQETHSSYDMKKVLKLFFRWFKTGDRRKKVNQPEPYEIQDVHLGKVKDKIVREDLITEEDLKQLLKACESNLRDKAFIHTHYDAGTRATEILTLRLRDVKFDDNGAIINVIGKTGARPIRLIESVPSLLSWVQNHPFKDNQDSPLWIITEKKHYGKPMTYHSAKVMIDRRAKKANLQKRIYLHLFRHSEATRTALFMGEAQLRKRHGWTPNSRMTARYSHIINEDVENAIFEHHGITPKEEKKPETPVKCQFCDMFNPSDSKTCSKCSKPLDLEYAIQLDEQKQEEKKSMQDQIDALKSDFTNLQNEKQGVEEGREEDKKTVTKEKKKREDHDTMLAKVLEEIQKQRQDMQDQIDELKKELSKKKD